ncbi:MAG: hypothetical protein KME14_01335 [Tildeniella torsiva UHER 1998/13D]|jgi:hypothetical protein|nr:hypothetical protein [Tildeniella torsiva UHER 1998/13D]
MSGFEKDGYWFLPEKPDREVFGRLIFYPEKAPKLLLSNTLEESKSIEQIANGNSFEVLNGYFLDGKEVTLVYCYRRGGLKTGVQTAEIFARYIIVGHHFKSKADIKFSEISARYTYLEEWVLSSSFEISWQAQDEESKHEITLKQSIESPKELGSLSGFTVSMHDLPWIPVEHLNLFRFLGEIPTKLSVEEKKSILFKSDAEKPFEDFIDALILFQDLLIFCTGEMINIYDVISFPFVRKKKIRIPKSIEIAMRLGAIEPENTVVSKSGFAVKSYGERYKAVEEEVLEPELIQIYFSTGAAQNEKQKLNRVKALLMFHEIKEKMPYVLTNWELNKQEVGSIFDLYLRLTYIPERHADDLFLTISQAIEAFHRVSHKQDKFDSDMFNSAREAMIKSIPKRPTKYGLNNNEESAELITKLREFIESKLQYINEFSLKERLVELYNEHQECLPDGLFELGEIEDFSKQVRDTRGSLTHLSKSSSQKRSKHIIPREERRELIRKLLVLLQACLIKKIGLDDAQVKAVLSRR